MFKLFLKYKSKKTTKIMILFIFEFFEKVTWLKIILKVTHITAHVIILIGLK